MDEADIYCDFVWDDLKTVAHEQTARGKPFFEDLAKNLDSLPQYNEWVKRQSPKKWMFSIDDQLEQCLTP